MACPNSMSSRFVTSLRRLEVNCEPSSVMRTLGMYVCLRNICVSTCVTASAVILRKGVAKRYLVKTSIAVRTCVKPFAGLKGPMTSICIKSRGKRYVL